MHRVEILFTVMLALGLVRLRGDPGLDIGGLMDVGRTTDARTPG
jgi:hypothetical protein